MVVPSGFPVFLRIESRKVFFTMSKKELTLAYSPCPNDTFLFYHLIHSQLHNNLSFREELKDVEELNQSAQKALYDTTKLSFAAYFQVMDKYDILECGSALGRGCGPLLIRKKGSKATIKNAKSILSPGILTTANLLLQLYSQTKDLPLQYLRYDKIMQKLADDQADLGVIIHEERFTYQDYDLEVVQDLGEWWEETTSHPIPLGCIAIKKSLGNDTKVLVENCIRESLDRAWADPNKPKEYILKNSQNKDLTVVQAHIDLYVNEFTRNLGEIGKGAIQELLSRAKQLELNL
jgi:1,4-dihydroxy-6-naphthoate synthase